MTRLRLLVTAALLVAVVQAVPVGSHSLAAAAPPSCAGVPATLWGTAGDDVLTGTDGPDVIAGLGGADLIRGKGDDDLICGGSGDDLILGGSGRDTIRGGKGDDFLDGRSGDDLIEGGSGDDSLLGGSGRDDLRGNGGDDILEAGGGKDVAAGGAGADLLYGNGSTDTLHGGSGIDIGVGGKGKDSCRKAETTRSCKSESWPVKILIANDTGAVTWEQREGGWITETIVDDPVEVAFGDMRGGVVFQAPYSGMPPGPPIQWRDHRGAVTTISPTPQAQFVDLYDLALIHGHPTIVHSRKYLQGALNSYEELAMDDLVDGGRHEVGTIGNPWEAGPSRAAVGGAIVMVSQHGYTSSWYDFRDFAGNVLEVPHNPYPLGSGPPPSVRTDGTLSDDGTLLVYTVHPLDNDEPTGTLELVVLNLDTGEELLRTDIGDPTEVRTWFVDYRDGLVLLSLSDGVSLVDLKGNVTAVPAVGRATFWP